MVEHFRRADLIDRIGDDEIQFSGSGDIHFMSGKQFGLTPRVLKVGWSYFDSARLPRILQPFLQQATAATNEAVYASVLDNWELVFIARNGTTRVMTTGFVLGARVPAQLASPGIMMLAFEPIQKVKAWLASSTLTP